MRKYGKMMFLCATLSLVWSVNLMAQDSTKSEMKTVFGGKKTKLKVNYLGLYLAPEYQYGQVGSGTTSLGGAALMLQFNKKFAIGATGFGSFRNRQNTDLNAQFGGFKMEYTVMPNAAVHVSFPLVIGVGGNGFDFDDDDRGGRGRDRDFDDIFDDDNRYNMSRIIQPGINVEANLSRYAKFYVGANYRFAFNHHSTNTTDLSGFAANAGLKLGIFDYALKKKAKKAKNPEEGKI